MCIWKVEEQDRQCGFCHFRGGCERYPRDKGYKICTREVFDEYYGAMFSVSGLDVRVRTRERRVVWARYMVSYRLITDGYSRRSTAKMLGLDRSSMFHAIGMVEEMLKMPKMYPEEYELWEKFTELLTLSKN